MAHEIETMAYVGATPWHKLGKALPAGISLEQLCTAAGLDWKVEKQLLALPNGAPTEHYAVVRSSDGRILGDRTVKKNFKLLQNDKAFAWFKPFVDSGLATPQTAGALFDGARIWVLAKLNQNADVIVSAANDVVERYILLAHAHDGSLAIHGGYTATRVVCNNTLSVGLGENTAIRIRHTANAGEALKAAQDSIMQAGPLFEKAAQVFRALAGKSFTNAQLTVYLRALFPATVRKAEIEAEARETFASLLAGPVKRRPDAEIEHDAAVRAAERANSRAHDRIVEILESGGRNGDLNVNGVRGTAWAAYNAVTEYMTWERGRTEDSRLSSLWFSNTGDKALQSAAETFLS